MREQVVMACLAVPLNEAAKPAGDPSKPASNKTIRKRMEKESAVQSLALRVLAISGGDERGGMVCSRRSR
jgi:hypothetical protein